MVNLRNQYEDMDNVEKNRGGMKNIDVGKLTKATMANWKRQIDRVLITSHSS